MSFAELDITSNFTFLTGASHPEEYVDRAALLGLTALAIADENSVAGIVRAHARVKEIARQVRERQEAGLIGPPAPMAGWAPKPLVYESYPGGAARRRNGTLAPEEVEDFLDGPKAAFETRVAPPPMDASAAILNVPRLIPAARIVLDTGFTATALPRDRAGWGRLCRLISRGRLRAEKGSCLLRIDHLLEFGEGLALILHPPPAGERPAPRRFESPDFSCCSWGRGRSRSSRRTSLPAPLPGSRCWGPTRRRGSANSATRCCTAVPWSCLPSYCSCSRYASVHPVMRFRSDCWRS